MKGDFTLKNGTFVTFEGSVEEVNALLSSYGNNDKNGTPEPRVIDYAWLEQQKKITETELNGRTTINRPKHYKKKHKQNEVWSENDIIGIAKIVRENLQMKSGLSSIIKTYIRKLADNRQRNTSTIYTITSDLKSYLRGNKESVGHRIRTILEREGITSTGTTHIPVRSL